MADRYVRLSGGRARSTGKRAQIDAARYNKWLIQQVERMKDNEALQAMRAISLDTAIVHITNNPRR